MEKALIDKKGKETLVSAFDIQADYGGRIPRGVRFICPFCRQPLNPAAMGFGGIQSPHFCHERNNERAHECEFFASSYGYYSTYQRVPMPMFVRRAKSGQSLFVVEGGFRFLGEDLVLRMEARGATLYIGQKRYKVTCQRFGPGLTKLPFEEVALNFGSIVRLSNSPVELNDAWGYPEDARKAMVFTRDLESKQGKRVKMGDSIPACSSLYLLAPDREEEQIRCSFFDAKKVGYAGSKMSGARLAVFEVDAPSNAPGGDPGVRYLEECGFKVSDIGETPELVWPPSLTSGGDMLPLFKSSKCIFTVPQFPSPNKELYIYTANDTSERVRSVSLRPSAGDGVSFGILRNDASLSFVATKDRIFSSAVLLHSDDNLSGDIPSFDAGLPIARETDSETLRVSLRVPGVVQLLRRNEDARIIKVDSEDSATVELNRKSFEAVRVLQKLGASLDELVTFEFLVCNTTRDEASESAGKSLREELLSLLFPSDARKAMARDAFVAKRVRYQRDRKFATVRKSVK